jgi:hypothetical protein
MANTTVSIRERIKTDTGWEWSRRIPIPDGKLNAARKVLLATSEDDPSDTLVPRLQAAGADLSKVILITVSKQIKGQPKSKRMLKLKEDAKLLEKALIANPDVALVALDPMSSFFGTEGGLNKDESVRPIMDSLAKPKGIGEEVPARQSAAGHRQDWRVAGLGGRGRYQQGNVLACRKRTKSPIHHDQAEAVPFTA